MLRRAWVLSGREMDGISRLLSAARLEASLDRRCLLARSTRMNVAEYGERQAPFHVLLDGTCQLQIGRRLLNLNPGDVVVIPSGAPHRILTPGGSSRRGTAESVQRNYIATRTDGAGDPVIDLFCGHYTYGAGAGALLFGSLPEPLHVSFGRSEASADVLQMLSSLMRGEAERDADGTAAILSGLCTVLLAMLLRTTPGTGGATQLWTAVSDRPIAEAIEAVIAEPGARWSIAGLSQLAGMSRATFVRHFSAAVGTSVGAFLTRVRLMAAAELLIDSQQTVASVARQVGYQSESAFTRAFRAEFATTPAKFRRAQRV